MILLGLERVARLGECLGNPQTTFLAVHVAGTNGKGSVTCFISSMLTNVAKIGSFVSPHLLGPWDCIRIGGVPISPQEYHTLHSSVLKVNVEHGIGATPFEILTCVAFVAFSTHCVELAVIEVGMGGLGDATNILPPPLVAVITKIGLDHTEFLGTTIPQITSQKGGIIKPGCRVVIGIQSFEDATTGLLDICGKIGCSPYIVSKRVRMEDGNTLILEWKGQVVSVILSDPMGPYLLENLSTALVALELLSDKYCVSTEDIIKGIQGFSWPGRLSWLCLPFSSSRVLVDGAHNDQGIQELSTFVNSLRKSNNLKRVVWILGFKNGKDVEKYMKNLVHESDDIIAVGFSQPEDMPWIECTNPQSIVDIASSLYPLMHPTFFPRIQDVALSHNPNELVVICGSLYLISDVYRLNSILSND